MPYEYRYSAEYVGVGIKQGKNKWQTQQLSM